MISNLFYNPFVFVCFLVQNYRRYNRGYACSLGWIFTSSRHGNKQYEVVYPVLIRRFVFCAIYAVRKTHDQLLETNFWSFLPFYSFTAFKSLLISVSLWYYELCCLLSGDNNSLFIFMTWKQKLLSHMVGVELSPYSITRYPVMATSLSGVAWLFRDLLVRMVLLTPKLTIHTHELAKDRAIFGPFPLRERLLYVAKNYYWNVNASWSLDAFIIWWWRMWWLNLWGKRKKE